MEKKTYKDILSWLEEAACKSKMKECDMKSKAKVKVHDGTEDDNRNLSEEGLDEEQLDEYETKTGTYVHKGTYGTSYKGDDEDDKKPAGEKRGRGRPVGSKSGARTQGAPKKSYSGLPIHSLNLPNSK